MLQLLWVFPFHYCYLFYIVAYYAQALKLNKLKTLQKVSVLIKMYLFLTLTADPTEHWILKVYFTYLPFSVMHSAASSGRASSVNFLNTFNRLLIFSISSGTNNARLAAMLRQLAQYHAKDPNNLFMVRLAQVGGYTKGTLYQTVCLSDYWLSAVCASTGSDSFGQRHTDTLSLP